MSYFDKAETSQDPHHWELMAEEFGNLVQSGCKEGWER